MDKYEYKVRSDEIKALIAEGEFEEAVKIADTIDWRRVKSITMLCTISDLYKINRRYQESKDILLMAYEKHPGGRLIVYSLCELCIKMEEYVQAIEYYKEFVQVAPKDTGRYVLQYKLYESQDVSLEERIAVLEEYKKKDYRAKWAYELAYLYHRVGLATKCVEECDEMFLWFSEDEKYVLKALELKELHQPLTEEQRRVYEEMCRIRDGEAEDMGATSELNHDVESDEEAAQDTIEVKPVDVGQYNTINLQQELAESMKEFFVEEEGSAAPDSQENVPVEEAVAMPIEQEQESAPVVEEEVVESAEQESEPVEEESVNPVVEAENVEATEEAIAHNTVSRESEIDTVIPVPAIPKEHMEPVMPAEATEPVTEEIFFEEKEDLEVMLNQPTRPLPSLSGKALAEEALKGRVVYPDVTIGQMRELASTGPIDQEEITKTVKKPSDYDEMLSQEYNGQISLVIPEEQRVEKQITGQLNIDDVLSEWERTKKANEEKRREDVRRRIKANTGNLFEDFDEATKSGLLEQIEEVVMKAIKDEDKKPEKAIAKVITPDHPASVPDAYKPAEPQKEEEKVEEPAEKPEEVAAAPEDDFPEIEVSFEEEAVEEPEEEVVAEEQEETDDEGVEEIEEVVEPSEDDQDDEDAPEKITSSGSLTEEWRALEVSMEQERLEREKAKAEAKAAAEKERAAHKKEEKPLDDGSVRKLTQEEKEHFAHFIQSKNTRNQLALALDEISLASYTGNVIITGEERETTIALAKGLVKEIQNSDSNFSGKVAKVTGSALNEKEIDEIFEKLENGALIIEKAIELKKSTIQEMNQALDKENFGIIVLMEGTKLEMDKLTGKYPIIEDKFTNRIDIEALNDRALVEFAKQYAAENEYSIDELGVLALHTRIAEMQTSDHEVTVAEVREIMDDAFYYADRKTPKHLMDVVLGKRYDEDDMIILREKDFMHY